ncbi:hypothetical protein BTN82_19435 [Pseudomonas chlororaphis]|uniref:Uncharacterized protein n=2 Tax=Pseudomonas chlororaphis TaxID=587753 RepID=A0A1Q8EMT3_9PSED|nr:hypothetical protein BTN82_19435 [Pseudomonas chlororaphis]
MITRILAVLLLAAIPAYSMAHNEYSIGSTEIELDVIELSADQKIKLSHLKIYADNEHYDDEGAIDNPPPSSPLNTTDDRDLSLTQL